MPFNSNAPRASFPSLRLSLSRSLEYCRQLDLRMNQLKFDADLVLFNQLLHLTHMDLSHNHRLIELDLRSLHALEKLICTYNNTTRLILNGHSLRQLTVAHNSKNDSLGDFVL